ncbi:MAG: hypothetical protein JXL80_01315 [Planctomycetes bacterium]|nr:hypothetical protein [Planctomycetota bacterium]
MVKSSAWSAYLGIAMVLCLACPALGQLGPEHVLLVVNENSDDSLAIRDAYLAKYGSDVRVWSYAGSTSVTITRATFDAELREPLDAYLRTTPVDGVPLYKLIRVLVTTKGVPRRIDDADTPGYGDAPTLMVAECSAGRFDAASVDSELTLLHQPLTAGSTPSPSNYANNHVRNPYHAATQTIDTYSRDNATVTKTALVFNSMTGGWLNGQGAASTKLAPGDIYLVTRLTGYTADEAIAALDRGGTIFVVRQSVTVVIDRDSEVLDAATPYSQGEDFPETYDILTAAGFDVVYDEINEVFVTTAALDVLGYASYGCNHNLDVGVVPSTYILDTLAFTLARGAIFNTYESFNGRDCETPESHDNQGQVADWIRIGGTFGLAHVYEPRTFSVGDNEILYERMLNQGWTFAEAAYASLPVLSWQNIVVGDPLARFEVSDAGPPSIRVQTEDNRDWVYQNTSGTLSHGGHKVGLTATLLDLNGNNSVVFTVRKVPGSGEGEVDIEAGPTAGQWTLYGSDYDLDAAGSLVIEVTCQGDLWPTPGTARLSLKCEVLGDIDGNGGAEPTDVSALINKLNGLATSSITDELRFDLDSNGGAEPSDLSLLIVILNGLL